MTRFAARSPRRDRLLAAWLFACAAMIAVMVVLGGVTRLTESGLSITEWQPVTGILPPLDEADWQGEFAKYQAIPQFKLLHSWMTLDDFKTIFFWEWLHRLWGRLIGFAFALPFLAFALRRWIPLGLIPRLISIFLLGAAQGALGWFMVKSGLADRTEVSQYRLVAHLGLALIIYAAIIRTALGLVWPSGPALAGSMARLRRAVAALAALVLLTMLAGGFVAGLDAGLTYNTFPLMDGHFVPVGYAQLSPFWRNWFENVAAVQFDHRLLAETVLTVSLAVWLWGRSVALPGRARRALDALLATALLQIALGIATLLLVVPVALGVVHQAGALLLFTTALTAHGALKSAAGTASRRAGQLDESAAALL